MVSSNHCVTNKIWDGFFSNVFQAINRFKKNIDDESIIY